MNNGVEAYALYATNNNTAPGNELLNSNTANLVFQIFFAVTQQISLNSSHYMQRMWGLSPVQKDPTERLI